MDEREVHEGFIKGYMTPGVTRAEAEMAYARDAADRAEMMLGRPLEPWQQELLRKVLDVDPMTGDYCYREIRLSRFR